MKVSARAPEADRNRQAKAMMLVRTAPPAKLVLRAEVNCRDFRIIALPLIIDRKFFLASHNREEGLWDVCNRHRGPLFNSESSGGPDTCKMLIDFDSGCRLCAVRIHQQKTDATRHDCQMLGDAPFAMTCKLGGMSDSKKYLNNPWLVVIALLLFAAMAGGTIFLFAHLLTKAGQ